MRDERDRRHGRAALAVAVALALAAPLLGTAPTSPHAAAAAGPAAEPNVVNVARGYAVNATGVAADALTWTETRPLGEGDSVVRFQQVLGGVPVYAGELAVALGPDGSLDAVTGEVAAETSAPAFVVDAPVAAGAAVAAVTRGRPDARGALRTTEPVRTLYAPSLVQSGGEDVIRPAWRVGVVGARSSGIAVDVLVDAVSSTVLRIEDRSGRLVRSICDARDDITSNIAAGSWCTHNDPNGYRLDVVDGSNAAALRAYNALGHAAAFYADVLGVDLTALVGLDTYRPYTQRLTPELTATVRYCEVGQECPYYNALWSDADPFFVPGPGRRYPGGQLFLGSGFDRSVDVTAHELTHGVTSATNALRYYGQPGAINESMSDVLGQLAQLYDPGARAFALARDSRWLVGEQLPRGAVRSMSSPSARWLDGGPQPDRMTSRWWATGSADAGGVHTNSGVGNKTAYLIARGGRFQGITVRGVGERATARIYWRAQNLLTSGASYRDLATALATGCAALYGRSSATCTSVRRATAATEIGASTVSVKRSASAVRAGATVRVRAQLRGARGGVLTVPRSQRPRLVMERRALGTDRWVRIRSANASVSGTKVWTVRVTRSSAYRVRYPGSVARGLAAASTTKVIRIRP